MPVLRGPACRSCRSQSCSSYSSSLSSTPLPPVLTLRIPRLGGAPPQPSHRKARHSASSVFVVTQVPAADPPEREPVSRPGHICMWRRFPATYLQPSNKGSPPVWSQARRERFGVHPSFSSPPPIILPVSQLSASPGPLCGVRSRAGCGMPARLTQVPPSHWVRLPPGPAAPRSCSSGHSVTLYRPRLYAPH